jgi:hypothetical protein
MKTVKVRSSVHVVGLAPGEEAEIDDTDEVRSLIKRGLLTLLVPAKAPKVQSAYAPASDGVDVPGLPYGDTADTQ